MVIWRQTDIFTGFCVPFRKKSYLCRRNQIISTIMCMFNISVKDELINETRQAFASETAMNTWLQQQVEALLMAYNASQQAARQKARQAIAAMRSQSEANGNAELTLDEINDEIRQARAARRMAL